jgi:hypothetical protein
MIVAVDLEMVFMASQPGEAWGAMFAPYAGEEEGQRCTKEDAAR